MKKDNHLIYQEKIRAKYGNRFTMLENYINASTRISIKCNACGTVFKRAPNKLLYLGGCRTCWAKQRIKTHFEFVEQIKKRHGGEIVVLSKYIRDNEKVLVQHTSCGAEYEIIASSILQAPRCGNCQSDRLREIFVKSHKQFVEDVKQKHGNKYEVLGQYQNAQTKILIRHNECGYEWEVRPISLLVNGKSKQSINSCPQCHYEGMRCKDPKTRQAIRNIRGRIIHILQGRAKSAPTMKLIGLKTREEFKQYIESKFLPGMNWGNYGSLWHIDHIQPCASFNFNNKEEQKKCFHHTNLQPLWAKDNRKKSSIYNGIRYHYGGEQVATKAFQTV